MSYLLADAYVRPVFNTLSARDRDIVCTLRDDSSRTRVKEFVNEYSTTRRISSKAGQVDGASRATVSKKYFDEMHRAKIIVTANPAGWEGDFRSAPSLLHAMFSSFCCLVT